MSSNIKSPLRYPGGKTRLAKSIIEQIPKDTENYYEPFFGGGSVGFLAQQNFKLKKMVVNDINKNLFSFWDTVKTNHENLIINLLDIKKNHKDGKLLFNEYKSVLNTTSDKYITGLSYFILNRIAFSGLTETGGFSQYSFENRFTYNSINKLNDTFKVLKNIDIKNVDYEKINYKTEKSIMYLDPPYYENKKHLLYGAKGKLHKEFDHKRLFNFCQEYKGKIILSYDNSDYIRNLYKNFNIKETNHTYSMTNVNSKKMNTKKELMIRNY